MTWLRPEPEGCMMDRGLGFTPGAFSALKSVTLTYQGLHSGEVPKHRMLQGSLGVNVHTVGPKRPLPQPDSR